MVGSSSTHAAIRVCSRPLLVRLWLLCPATSVTACPWISPRPQVSVEKRCLRESGIHGGPDSEAPIGWLTGQLRVKSSAEPAWKSVASAKKPKCSCCWKRVTEQQGQGAKGVKFLVSRYVASKALAQEIVPIEVCRSNNNKGSRETERVQPPASSGSITALTMHRTGQYREKTRRLCGRLASFGTGVSPARWPTHQWQVATLAEMGCAVWCPSASLSGSTG